MAINKRFILRGALAVLLVSTALLTGLMMTNANGDTWAGHEDTDWYDPIYSTYTIDEPEKLAGVAKLLTGKDEHDQDVNVNGFEGKILQIDKDLDISAYQWIPIGNEAAPFKGTFITKDGVDYKINGLRLQGNWNYAGLFGYVEDGTVGGFTITSASNAVYSVNAAAGNVYAGAIVGFMKGNSTVFDVTNQLSIQAGTDGYTAYVGGLVGYSEGKTVGDQVLAGKLSNVTNQAAITVAGQAMAGGILGSAGGAVALEIKTPNNSGAVTVNGGGAQETVAGGIIGYAQAKIDLEKDDTITSNSGAVAVYEGSYSYAGGIVGKSDTHVEFSIYTFNQATVEIQAPQAAASYSGGLIGASAGTLNYDVAFVNNGSITNNGGTEVYTGGLIGLLKTPLSWGQDFTNTVAITASGTANVFTGGVIGKALLDTVFHGHVVNNGVIQVTANSTLSQAYTGGLIGYAETQIWLENEDAGAYANNGALQVAGNEFLYTGGIISNRTYSRTDGLPANVSSTGNITVTGNSNLYTGGYIGRLGSEAIQQSLTGAAYAGQITVQGSADAENMVATGGIIGFYESDQGDALLSNLSFAGQLQATAGDAATYTGGIVGFAQHAMIDGVQAGAVNDAHAIITADGVLGGIAGYANGSIEQAEVKHLTLTASSVGAFAGGIAGQATGTIANAVAGDNQVEGSSSVVIKTDIPGNASGVDQLTAGGIVGSNTTGLVITNSGVERITLETAADHAQYVFGGIAGALNEQAIAGEAATPLYVNNMTIALLANNSQVGGAIGFNKASELYINTDYITIAASGSQVAVGGVFGKNSGDLQLDTAVVYSGNSQLTASGIQSFVGGIAGENTGTLVESTSEKADLTVTGEDSVVGGIAGYHASKLVNVKAVNASIKSQAERVRAGGIVGYSAPNDETTADGVSIENAVVEKTEALPLLTTTAANTKIGGIGGSVVSTRIINPTVKAIAPNSVILLGQAASTMAGGIAGYLENSTVTGDAATVAGNADNMTIRNIAFRFNAQAADGYIGGLAGYAEASGFDAMSVHTAIITLEGARGTVGGAVGYYHSDSAANAIISNLILNTITLRGMETSGQSTIGGMIGVNAAQAADPVAAPESAGSTVKNARIIGNLANPNSPIIDSRATASIIGGIVGDNSSFIANVSLIDQNALSVSGASSIVGGHTGINRETGVIYNTYANAKLAVTGATATAGGLVGSNEGAIIGSYVDTAVSSASAGVGQTVSSLGGLVGSNEGDIKTSYVNSNVVASGTKAIVGGLVGLQLSGSIDNSYAGGKVTASGTASYAGGFAGKIADGSIQYSYSAMNVSAASSAHAGGFAGRYDNASKNLLYKNYYIKDEKVNLNKDLPDFAEGNYRWLNIAARLNTVLDETLKDREQFPELSGWNFESIWRYGSVNAKYLYPELVRVANNGGGNNEHNVNANVAWYTLDPDAAIYEIRTEAELSGLAAIVNGTVPGVEQFGFDKRIIRIMNPIHIQANEWIPIGRNENHPFEGTFDGNGDAVQGEGYLIDGYRMSNGTATAGLFGFVDAKAAIENVNLEPLTLAGTEYVGALAAVNHGKLSNVKIHLEDGVGLRGKYVGGLAGKNTGTITGIKLTSTQTAEIAAIVAEGAVGSLIGVNESNLNAGNAINNEFKGQVISSSNDTVIGGWIGSQTGSIEDLTVAISYDLQASGDNNVAGGFVGHYQEGALKNIALTLKNKKFAATSSSSILGGVVGRSEAAQVSNNIAVASEAAAEPVIQGNGIVGGVIGSKTGSAGQQWDVETVSFTGVTVGSQSSSTANTTIGGIIGQLEDTAVKAASFVGQLAPISQQTTTGGIVGMSNDSVLYDTESAPQISFDAQQGTSVLGGIAGVLSASDTNDSYSLDHAIPLYMGVYLANVHDASLKATGKQSGVSVAIGGIAGHNADASIYFSDAAADLSAADFLSAKLGGVAGESSGVIVQASSSPDISADRNTLVWAGGAVGLAQGGAIHYTKVLAPDGQQLAVSGLKTALPVLPEAYAGGFVGTANEVEMSRVFSELDVKIESDNQEDAIYAGGFAGALGSEYELDRASVQWAHASGDVSIIGKSVSFAGGFSGTINHYDVTDAYAKGTVEAAGHDMRSGGFAAAVDRRAVITNSYALQDKLQVIGLTGTTRAYVGGFAAYNEGSLENVYAHASDMNNVTGANTYKGGLVGYLFSDGSVTDSAYRFNGQAVGYSIGESSNLVQEDRLAAINLADWELPTDATLLLHSINELVVYSPQQLNSSVLLTNDSTGLGYIKLFKRDAVAKLEANTALGADIDLTNWSWKPYHVFDLVFDGQGHSITGLKLAVSDEAQAGFMQENSGTVQNVRFTQAKVTAGEQANAAVVVGTNLDSGKISSVEVEASVTGGAATGAISGSNKGSINDVLVEATLSGSDYVGGIAGSNEGSVEDATVDVKIAAGKYVGGIAGSNEGSITGANVKAEAAGSEYAGGVAGSNEGSIADTIIDHAVVAGEQHVGGVAGSNKGSITGINVEAEIADGQYAGGIAGINEGDIIDAAVTAGVSGQQFVGGIAGASTGSIEDAAVTATVTGGEHVGGVAGSNEGSIEKSSVDASITGGSHVGGIAGINTAAATITEANATGTVTGTGEAGGLTGGNAGSISKSYAANTVSAPIAGGIAGSHAAGATIAQAFTFGTVTSNAPAAIAGGIAGTTSGAISNSYAAGVIKAAGSEQAHAGGIAGYAQAGQLSSVMSFGEVTAEVNGKIFKGKSFAGGIAGQKLAAAAIQTAAFNKQMLQADSAYYNENGIRVSGAATGFGLDAKALTSGQLPFAGSDWKAVAGFFPQLTQFAGTEAATVSSAAILLEESDSLHQVSTEFKASHAGELNWSASKAQFTVAANQTNGHVTDEGIIEITVSAEQFTKLIRLNVPQLGYEHKAAAPSFVNEPAQFEETVMVGLVSTDAGAEIYYTLDNTAPTAQSLHYTAPIELTATTTIRAIAIVDDMTVSEELLGIWVKQVRNSGGIFIPVEPEPIAVFVGDKKLPAMNGSRATLARNSKLVLAVPDDVTVYYTTDGSMPTEQSPVYKGELLITHNMQIKYMTDKNPVVVTLNYNVAPAQFSVKKNAANLTYMNGYSDNTFAPNQAITREELIAGLFELLNFENVPLGTLLTDIEGEQAELVAKFESAGLVEGYSDGTFRGSNGLTRAEFVAIVTRILKLDAGSSTKVVFADVDGHWATKYINAVAAAGYIKGYPDGTFKPEQKITRAEAVVLINRMFGIKAKNSNDQAFTDVPPAHWAYRDIMDAAK